MACLLGIQNEIQALCTKIQNALYAALAGIVFRYLYKSANYEEFLTKYLNTLHFLHGMLFLQCSKTCLQHEEKFEACRDFFSGQIKRANDQDLFGYKNSKNRGNTKDIFFFKTQVSVLGTLFFRTNNWVKNLVKTFQCVMCPTAYLPTHSLKSPVFLVPATLDDEGKNANFPSTPPHCRRHRAVAPAGLSMSVAENLLDTEHTLNPSSHLGFLLSCLSVCLSV